MRSVPTWRALWAAAEPGAAPAARRPFATVPGTDLVLPCDVWQPPADVSASGVAVYISRDNVSTLLKHGTHDEMAPIGVVRELAGDSRKPVLV